MDLPRSRRPSPDAPTTTPLLPQTLQRETMRLDTGSCVQDKKSGRATQLTWVLLLAVGGTLLFTILLSVKAQSNQKVVAQSLKSDTITPSSGGGGRIRNRTWDRLQQQLVQAMQNSGVGHDDHSRGTKSTDAERSMKGLLADFGGFESADKCTSRGHRSTKYPPTPSLIQRLRDYEELHRKCAPRAETFVSDILQFKESSSADHGSDCRFVVWIAYSGLGNRLLSLVSAFLYALLTNRVLLVDRSGDTSELFCEPFPGTSWLVPPAFPYKWMARQLNETSEHRFGKQFNTSAPSPPFSYIHLTHTYNLDDRMFFCDQAQEYLYHIPWVFMRANNYIVPGLYFLSSFRPQLDDLFSEKEAIFHLLGRYLFHPSNTVWGWINRFRKAYLVNSGKQVGFQIRSFNNTHQDYFQEQLSQCALENKVLPTLSMEPEYNNGKSSDMESESEEVTSILVTSLQPEYYEKIRDFYLSARTQDGQFVAVHQPSHEGWQKTGTLGHDLKAWADIYLLSFSDALITSGWSTFGYTAQALAGVKPWILYRSFDYTVPNPPCTYARSIEPCFHTPPLMDCKGTGAPRDPAKVLPFVQTCEDIPWGIKLVEPVVR